MGFRLYVKGYDIDEMHVDLSSLITSAMQHKLVTDRGVTIRRMIKQFGWCSMTAPDGRVFMINGIDIKGVDDKRV